MLVVAGLQGMLDCPAGLAFPFEPPAGTAMQCPYALRRYFGSQQVSQQVSKEVMIAIPPPLVVQGHKEQILPL